MFEWLLVWGKTLALRECLCLSGAPIRTNTTHAGYVDCSLFILLCASLIIGASLSESHIVVISITFSCPTRIRLTSVDPIAYNRISTWKTGILRARWILLKLRHATCARPRSGQPIGLRANCASGLDTPCSVHERCPSIYAGWVCAVAEISMRWKCAPLLICHLNCTGGV